MFTISCSLYESDAREFLKEQGFEFSATNKASISSLANKHCFQTANSSQEPEWENNNSSEQEIINYYDSSYSCSFVKTNPNSWKASDYPILQEIVESYTAQL